MEKKLLLSRKHQQKKREAGEEDEIEKGYSASCHHLSFLFFYQEYKVQREYSFFISEVHLFVSFYQL